jgi:hypothetical protein
MSTVEDQVRARIEAFMTEISALVRVAAMEAVALALASGEPLPLPASARRPPTAAPALVPRPRARPASAPAATRDTLRAVVRELRAIPEAVAAPAAARETRTAPPVLKKGEKRPPAFLAETVRRLYDHIRANPGQGIEQIGREMHVLTKDLSLPIKKLLADGRITAVGLKRATKYFPR